LPAARIGGWLTGINRPSSTQTGYEESDLFNLQLNYNTVMFAGLSVPQYNGNIAEEGWKSGYDEYLRGFTFKYDKANRLNASTYAYLGANDYGPQWIFTKRYQEDDIQYDRNGNLLTLDRYHGDWNKIDYLNYKNYKGNHLGRGGGLVRQ
jgi:hypothetical protein